MVTGAADVSSVWQLCAADDPLWQITFHGVDPLREREVESWFAVANGRTGTRGALEEDGAHSSPAMYVAGLYTGIALEGEAGRRLLVGPNWTRLAPRAAGQVLSPTPDNVLEHRRVLDLHHGVLLRHWRVALPSGAQAWLRSVRFASLADRSVLALWAELSCDTAEPRLGTPVPVEGSDAEVVPAGGAGRHGRQVFELAPGQAVSALVAVITREGDGRLERVVVVDRGSGEASRPSGSAELLAQAEAQDVGSLLERHRAAWEARWRDADVLVEGDQGAQVALRFALYHLICAAEPDSDLASVGARALTGSGYDGHVFWDTDVFVVPFLTYTHPASARALLSYRYRTLDPARRRARALGYRGALYAWESADSGEDVTPSTVQAPDGSLVRVLTGGQEHHISADVAWAVWRYWQVTGEDDFLVEMGAEMILETARFWASRVRSGADGRFHIDTVIGPDEYHEAVRDNAFTNVMARWNLRRGLDVATWLRDRHPAAWRRLAGRLDLRPEELTRWGTVAAALVDGLDPSTLLYEQFSGYFDLEDVLAQDLARRPFVGEVALSRERLRRSRLVKQADVLMLPLMLPEEHGERLARVNYDFYEPRTSHGSSLSPAAHAVAAARVGRPEEALAYFRMAAAVDLSDTMGNAAQGVHIASLGGLWQAAVLGFGGVRAQPEALLLDPRLPAAWSRLRFPVTWRGRRVEVDCGHDQVVVSLDQPVVVAVGGSPARQLPPGRHAARRMRDSSWSGWEEAAV